MPDKPEQGKRRTRDRPYGELLSGRPGALVQQGGPLEVEPAVESRPLGPPVPPCAASPRRRTCSSGPGMPAPRRRAGQETRGRRGGIYAIRGGRRAGMGGPAAPRRDGALARAAHRVAKASG